jgi:O-methyltransferase involved in polyketide biosynthesis
MLRYLEYRHRILDAIVADHRPDCLIEVGAGLSRRPVTWVLDHDVRAIEIDLAALAGVKRAAIERAPSILRERLADRHRIITDDLLAPGFADRLREAIGDAVRPIVVTEGVLSYFSAADRHAAVSAIADGLSGFPHGAFVSEFHTQSRRRQLGNGPVGMRWAIRMLTRRKQALDGYADIEAVHAALARAGFGTSRTVERLEYTLPEHLERMRSPLSFVVAYSRSRSHTRSSNDDR